MPSHIGYLHIVLPSHSHVRVSQLVATWTACAASMWLTRLIRAKMYLLTTKLITQWINDNHSMCAKMNASVTLCCACHDPSHGGFYMTEGALYIRIGLPPRVVSGDCLVSSRCGLTARYLHCRRAYPMSRDWGCISTYCLSSYVPTLVYAALGAIPTVTCTVAPMVVCIPWRTLPYALDTDSSPPCLLMFHGGSIRFHY